MIAGELAYEANSNVLYSVELARQLQAERFIPQATAGTVDGLRTLARPSPQTQLFLRAAKYVAFDSL